MPALSSSSTPSVRRTARACSCARDPAGIRSYPGSGVRRPRPVSLRGHRDRHELVDGVSGERLAALPREGLPRAGFRALVSSVPPNPCGRGRRMNGSSLPRVHTLARRGPSGANAAWRRSRSVRRRHRDLHVRALRRARAGARRPVRPAGDTPSRRRARPGGSEARRRRRPGTRVVLFGSGMPSQRAVPMRGRRRPQARRISLVSTARRMSASRCR